MTTVVKNKSVDTILKVLCSTCKNINKHKVAASVEISGSEEWGDGEMYYWDGTYQIIECQGCETFSFRSDNSNSEEYFEDGRTISNELIYPKRTSETWNTKGFFNIPSNLRRIYRETVDCFNNQNLTLCGAGIRALVEGLCKENGVIDGEIEINKADGTISKKRVDNLQGKINGLHEIGKLTKENAEILHEHRFLGNTAIHDLTAPSTEEITLALEIIEHVFDNLYEIPEKAMQLKHKRLRKKI
jgi:hypothetical protein